MVEAGRTFERMRDFLTGRLPDDERRMFEDSLVRDPQLASELEDALRFKEGLRQLRAQGYFEELASGPKRLRVWLPALAAAALAGLALFIWVYPRPGTVSVLTASANSGTGVAQPIAAHFTFVSMRGGSTPNLSLPSRGLVEFRAAPALSKGASTYRATLMRGDGGTATALGSVTGLAPGASGYVSAYADSLLLQPGGYTLRLESETGTTSADAFTFNLVAGAPSD